MAMRRVDDYDWCNCSQSGAHKTFHKTFSIHPAQLVEMILNDLQKQFCNVDLSNNNQIWGSLNNTYFGKRCSNNIGLPCVSVKLTAKAKGATGIDDQTSAHSGFLMIFLSCNQICTLEEQITEKNLH